MQPRSSPQVLVFLVALVVKCRCQDLPGKSVEIPRQDADTVLKDSWNQDAVLNGFTQSALGDVEGVSVSEGLLLKVPLEVIRLGPLTGDDDDDISEGPDADQLSLVAPQLSVASKLFEAFTGVKSTDVNSKFLSDEQLTLYSIILSNKYKEFERLRQNISVGCLRDLNYSAIAVRSNKIWALKLLDAVSKPQSTVMVGNVIHLGNYDECLNVAASDGEQQRIFIGQYCLLSGGFIINDVDIGKMKAAFRKNSTNFHEVNSKDMKTLMDMIVLQYGVCVPSSCTREDVLMAANGMLAMAEIDSKFRVRDAYCTIEGDSRLFTGLDWFTIWIMIIVLLLVATCTCYDLRKTGSKNPVLSSFSVHSNWKGLVSHSEDEAPGTLDCIYGIRFLSIAWMITGHRMVMEGNVPVQNFLDADRMMQRWRALPLLVFPLTFDTFFALSGLLLSYKFLKEIRNSKLGFNVPFFYLMRLLRVSPAYYLVLLFHSTLLLHLGEGPIWVNFIERTAAECSSLWYNVFYISNYFSAPNDCLGQSWYLAADMQLFLISPIFLYVAWKRPRSARVLMTTLIFIGVLISFSTNYYYRISAASTLQSSLNRLGDMTKEWFPTHTRYTPWLIGLLTGCSLHNIQGRKFRLSKTNQMTGWILAMICLVIATAGKMPFQQPAAVYHPVKDSLYTALSRPLWAAAMCWLIFTCVVGCAGPLNTFLSWRIFQPLSRLTYGAFLVHVSFQQLQRYCTRTPLFFQDQEEMARGFGDTMISFLVAIPLLLLFELPIINLIKVMILKAPGKSTRRTLNGASVNKIKYCEKCNHSV